MLTEAQNVPSVLTHLTLLHVEPIHQFSLLLSSSLLSSLSSTTPLTGGRRRVARGQVGAGRPLWSTTATPRRHRAVHSLSPPSRPRPFLVGSSRHNSIVGLTAFLPPRTSAVPPLPSARWPPPPPVPAPAPDPGARAPLLGLPLSFIRALAATTFLLPLACLRRHRFPPSACLRRRRHRLLPSSVCRRRRFFPLALAGVRFTPPPPPQSAAATLYLHKGAPARVRFMSSPPPQSTIAAHSYAAAATRTREREREVWIGFPEGILGITNINYISFFFKIKS